MGFSCRVEGDEVVVKAHGGLLPVNGLSYPPAEPTFDMVGAIFASTVWPNITTVT